MRCPGDQPGQRVLRTRRGVGGRPCAHAPARRVAPGAPPRRFAHAEGLAGCRGKQDRTTACKDADAAGGDRGDLLQAENIGSCAWSQDLSLSAAQLDYRSSEPGVGIRYNLHPDGARLPLSRWRHALVRASHSGLAPVDHARCGFLHRRDRGGFAPLWQAGDLQLRSRQPVHSDAFTDILITKGIAISMDGKGSWRDNVFVERFWRTLKYEEVYLKAYESVAEARSSIGCYLEFYNGRRPHSALDRRTPDQAYYASLPLTPVGVPLNDAGILFREPEPPLGMAGGEVMGSESRWLRVTVACGSGC